MGLEMNCCGFSLKHGTVIIGVFQSILAFMCLVLSAAYADNPHEIIDMSDPAIIPNLTVLRCILIIISLGSAMQFTFSILLIFAAETNRPNLIIPWLTLNPVAVILYITGTLIAIIHHSPVNNTTFIVGHLLFSLAFTLIVIYQIRIVWNFFKHLKSLNF